MARRIGVFVCHQTKKDDQQSRMACNQKSGALSRNLNKPLFKLKTYMTEMELLGRTYADLTKGSRKVEIYTLSVPGQRADSGPRSPVSNDGVFHWQADLVRVRDPGN
ncbi:hypothetical protein H107_01036 [Trichophyton rubrum CBS 202.88]|nr:hypothetical protein H100_00987 [Trichophyton rubrum MR850]EZG20956.1 hypothetical protein H107_01036 [Trichophyton rubrum CBS 202.88]